MAKRETFDAYIDGVTIEEIKVLEEDLGLVRQPPSQFTGERYRVVNRHGHILADNVDRRLAIFISRASQWVLSTSGEAVPPAHIDLEWGDEWELQKVTIHHPETDAVIFEQTVDLPVVDEPTHKPRRKKKVVATEE